MLIEEEFFLGVRKPLFLGMRQFPVRGLHRNCYFLYLFILFYFYFFLILIYILTSFWRQKKAKSFLEILTCVGLFLTFRFGDTRELGTVTSTLV